MTCGQVIKENRLVVRGRHEERTSELVSKSKYSKEFDLGERIDDQSVRGGVSSDGRLLHVAYSSWWRSTVVERRSLTGELSLSFARPAADG